MFTGKGEYIDKWEASLDVHLSYNIKTVVFNNIIENSEG